jgi:hypothetical protein
MQTLRLGVSVRLNYSRASSGVRAITVVLFLTHLLVILQCLYIL